MHAGVGEDTTMPIARTQAHHNKEVAMSLARRLSFNALIAGALASSASPASPSAAIAARIWRQMPRPAAPAPSTSTRSSAMRRPWTRLAVISPASATAPVPWISSLNDSTRSRYRSMMSSALSLRKSSHCTQRAGEDTSSHGVDEFVEQRHRTRRPRRRRVLPAPGTRDRPAAPRCRCRRRG